MTDDSATDGEAWEVAAIAVVSGMEAGYRNAEDFWRGLGVERDDVLQEARVRAWKAFENYDGRTSMGLHCRCAARYAVANYVYSQADQRGLLTDEVETFLAGLDDEKHEKPATREVPFSQLGADESTEVHRTLTKRESAERDERERRETAEHLRFLLDSVAVTCLTDRERRILFGRFGVGAEVPLTMAELAEELGVSHATVYREYDSAMEKMRGEMQAAKVLGEID